MASSGSATTFWDSPVVRSSTPSHRPPLNRPKGERRYAWISSRVGAKGASESARSSPGLYWPHRDPSSSPKGSFPPGLAAPRPGRSDLPGLPNNSARPTRLSWPPFSTAAARLPHHHGTLAPERSGTSLDELSPLPAPPLPLLPSPCVPPPLPVPPLLPAPFPVPAGLVGSNRIHWPFTL